MGITRGSRGKQQGDCVFTLPLLAPVSHSHFHWRTPKETFFFFYVFFSKSFFLPTGSASGAEQKADYSLARSKFPLIIWHSVRLCAKPASARRRTHRNTVAGVAQLCSFGWVTEIDFFLFFFLIKVFAWVQVTRGCEFHLLLCTTAYVYNCFYAVAVRLFSIIFKEQQLHWCDDKICGY